MHDHLQKPFLTVETGEAYHPIRLLYNIHDEAKLLKRFEELSCLEKKSGGNWQWYWRAECDDLQFESLDLTPRNPDNPLRLGTLTIHERSLQLNLSSFKRACLAVPFFHRLIDPSIALIDYADFTNKVFALDERLKPGFADLFKEEELTVVLQHRCEEYEKLEKECAAAQSAEAALALLTEYTNYEMQKKLPFAERYVFDVQENDDPDLLFLGFYIFLRSRELVALRRWYGEASYSLQQAADQTLEKVFGGVGLDLIE